MINSYCDSSQHAVHAKKQNPIINVIYIYIYIIYYINFRNTIYYILFLLVVWRYENLDVHTHHFIAISHHQSHHSMHHLLHFIFFQLLILIFWLIRSIPLSIDHALSFHCIVVIEMLKTNAPINICWISQLRLTQVFLRNTYFRF